MSSRRKSPRRELPPASEIPQDILGSAQRLQARTGDQTTLELKAQSYREIQALSIAEQAIRIATLEGAQPSLTPEQHEHFFKVADAFGRSSPIEAHRFDTNRNSMHPVTLTTKAVDKDGYLLYLPGQAVHHVSKNGSMKGLAFTHAGVNWSEEKIVSFVSTDRSIGRDERARMASTEIGQNRLAITGVQLEKGRLRDIWQAYEPFQESIANGVGNMLGSIAIGATYRQYNAYVNNVYTRTPMFGNTLPRTMLNPSLLLVAPHVMFDQQAYDQIADGEVPETIPELIPLTPTP